MLLRIIPPPPQAAVIFPMFFHNLKHGLDTPAYWSMQLDVLDAQGLESPGTAGMHALDKAACLVNMLEGVDFDMANNKVVCTFLDGSKEEWPLSGGSVRDALGKVVADVVDVKAERERERMALVRAKQSRDLPPLPPKSQSLLPMPSIQAMVGPRHKKQRSSIMSFVSSFLSKPASSSSTLPTVAPSRPLSPPSTRPVDPQLVTFLEAPSSWNLACVPKHSWVNWTTSKKLQHRARALLVDIWARHVLSELRRRFARCSYAPWIAESMLRRAETRMAELRKLYGLTIATPRQFQEILSPSLPHGLFLTSSDCVDEPEEEDDADSASIAPSMTDSASVADSELVRTPPDSLSRNHSLATTPALEVDEPTIRLVPTAEEIAEYTQYNEAAGHLKFVLRKLRTNERGRQLAEKNGLRALEIKSRRRAWSTCSLGPQKTALVQDCDLGIPIKPSPLGMYDPVTAEDLQLEAEMCLEAGLEALRARSPPPHYLTIASGPHDLSDLFFVADDEENNLNSSSLLHETFPQQDDDFDLEAQAYGSPYGYNNMPFPPSPTDLPYDVCSTQDAWIPSSVARTRGPGNARGSHPSPSAWLSGASGGAVKLTPPTPAFHPVKKMTSSRPRSRSRSRSEPVIVLPLDVIGPCPPPGLDSGSIDHENWLQNLEAHNAV